MVKDVSELDLSFGFYKNQNKIALIKYFCLSIQWILMQEKGGQVIDFQSLALSYSEYKRGKILFPSDMFWFCSVRLCMEFMQCRRLNALLKLSFLEHPLSCINTSDYVRTICKAIVALQKCGNHHFPT